MLKMFRNLKDIAAWLGHSQIQTTMDIYGHYDIESKRAVATGFEFLLES